MNGGSESTIDVIIVTSMTVISVENGIYGALVQIVPKCQHYLKKNKLLIDITEELQSSRWLDSVLNGVGGFPLSQILGIFSVT